MIKENRIKLILILVAPFGLIFLAIFISGYISIKPELTPLEQNILNYHSEAIELPQRKETRIVKSEDPFKYIYINQPVSTTQTKANKNLKPKASQEKIRLSLTIIGTEKRLAILDGYTVKEGDKFKGYFVKKIGSDRVILLKNGTKRIIFLEE